jgi:crotonobetainyl-CoA:carnitine CoA-transferase CaiB-like acyl-CoA transferase
MDLTLLNDVLKTVGEAPADDEIELPGNDPVFPLVLPIGEPGAASIGASALAAARLWELRGGRRQRIRVDVDAAAAAMRGDRYLVRERASTDTAPSPREVRGDRGDIYQAADGRWVYLHRGFAHHRARIAGVLDGANDEAALVEAVAKWKGLDLEDAVHAAGACAGMVRSYEEWAAHEQGKAIASMPLMEIERLDNSPPEPLSAAERPLAGIRVLDLTRVLAGPTCARTLAEHGADVLRIGTDLLPNNETQIIETGHGKRSAVLDLTTEGGAEQLRTLTKSADVFSQGYRPGSLAARGFSFEEMAKIRPGIVYVTICAFSENGPWSHRRGFDTLVQSVSGISNDYVIGGQPRLLPLSVLDYTTGYLAAFGVMAALRRRALEGGSYHVRISLAQAGWWVTHLPHFDRAVIESLPKDLPSERIEALKITTDTPFGRIHHLGPVAQLSETPARWERPTVPLDHDAPEWLPAAPVSAR